jgi:chromosomal replication initiation ATPase DnaA
VIGEVCRYLGVDASELTGATRKLAITRARALIGYMATRELAISGSAVARRLNQDRSAVSRAAQRVHRDAKMRTVSSMLLKKLYAQTNQQ